MQYEQYEQCTLHISSRHIGYRVFGLCLYCFLCEYCLKDKAMKDKPKEKRIQIHD